MPKGIYARSKSVTPRSIARDKVLKTYIGGPCKHCGGTKRRVASAYCAGCFITDFYAKYGRKYYHRDKDRILAQQKLYRRDPKNKPGILSAVKSCGKRRRLRDKTAEGHHTKQEWEDLKTFFGHRCLCCGKHQSELRQPLERDHIVPVIRGGTHWIDNIQPLCKICNARKGTGTADFRPVADPVR
jgi:5-methylcytosine-specific restriction endonuclease McrA